MNILDRSSLKEKNSLSYFEHPEIAELGWVCHAFLTRQGGVSLPPYESLNLCSANGDQEENVLKNKYRVGEVFGFEPRRLVILNQIHQDRILLVREPINTLASALEYDAMITNAPNTFLGIVTADCLPIFVLDRKKKVISAIHAGRQGTALHIVSKVLKKMKEEFGSSLKDLIVAMGPSIGPCCYEIDKKVFIPEWAPFSTPREKERWMVDLARINIFQIEKEGIRKEQIVRINLCTSCHSDLFFSYRKEGQTGRQLSFIGII